MGKVVTMLTEREHQALKDQEDSFYIVGSDDDLFRLKSHLDISKKGPVCLQELFPDFEVFHFQAGDKIEVMEGGHFRVWTEGGKTLLEMTNVRIETADRAISFGPHVIISGDRSKK